MTSSISSDTYFSAVDGGGDEGEEIPGGSLEGGDVKVVAVVTRTEVYLLQGDASRSRHFSQMCL